MSWKYIKRVLVNMQPNGILTFWFCQYYMEHAYFGHLLSFLNHNGLDRTFLEYLLIFFLTSCNTNYKLKKLESSSLNCFSFHNSFCEDIIKVLTWVICKTTKAGNHRSCLQCIFTFNYFNSTSFDVQLQQFPTGNLDFKIIPWIDEICQTPLLDNSSSKNIAKQTQ